jgi:hypothetical protein
MSSVYLHGALVDEISNKWSNSWTAEIVNGEETLFFGPQIQYCFT